MNAICEFTIVTTAVLSAVGLSILALVIAGIHREERRMSLPADPCCPGEAFARKVLGVHISRPMYCRSSPPGTPGSPGRPPPAVPLALVHRRPARQTCTQQPATAAALAPNLAVGQTRKTNSSGRLQRSAQSSSSFVGRGGRAPIPGRTSWRNGWPATPAPAGTLPRPCDACAPRQPSGSVMPRRPRPSPVACPQPPPRWTRRSRRAWR